jgi:hypothetical protein
MKISVEACCWSFYHHLACLERTDFASGWIEISFSFQQALLTVLERPFKRARRFKQTLSPERLLQRKLTNKHQHIEAKPN